MNSKGTNYFINSTREDVRQAEGRNPQRVFEISDSPLAVQGWAFEDTAETEKRTEPSIVYFDKKHHVCGYVNNGHLKGVGYNFDPSSAPFSIGDRMDRVLSAMGVMPAAVDFWTYKKLHNKRDGDSPALRFLYSSEKYGTAIIGFDGYGLYTARVVEVDNKARTLNFEVLRVAAAS
jgi:hypothetical protein